MIKTNNIKYKDDFNSSDVEEKNYLRILFNGGRSVQIRELNQIQSILQSQIDKFGSSIYKPGTAVIGGACTFDSKIYTIKFDNSNFIASSIDRTSINYLVQTGNGRSIKANVIDFSDDGNFTTYYIRYSSGDGNFDIESSVGLDTLDVNGVSNGNSDSIEPDSISIVAAAFLSDGVFFVNGSFVVVQKQNVFIPYNDINDFGDRLDYISGNVVLTVTENYVSYIQDETLLDNANGQPNQMAPGADRYQILLKLNFLGVNENINGSSSIIVLMKIKNNNVVFNTNSKYSDLDRQLAQRTYEESGNYTINPFNLQLSDLVGSGRPGSEDLLEAYKNIYVGIEPSIAYVDGYRIELNTKYDLTIPRALEVVAKKVDISLNIGNFIDVSIIDNVNPYDTLLPQIEEVNHLYYFFGSEGVNNQINAVNIIKGRGYKIASLGSSDFTSLGASANVIGTYFIAISDGVVNTGTGKVYESGGSTRIKAIENAGAKFRLFLFDINMFDNASLNTFVSLTSFNGTTKFTLDNVSLQDTNSDSAVFKLPYNNIQSLASTASPDFVYTIKKTFNKTLTSSSTVITTGSNETFNDLSSNNFLIQVNGIWKDANAYIFSGSPSSITISGNGLVGGDVIKVVVPVTITNTTPASKELTTITETVEAPISSNSYVLSKSDIRYIEEVRIFEGTNDLTSEFVISFDGQTSSKYTNAEVRYVGIDVPPKIDITYTYYKHTGLPFTANSYQINFNEATTLAPGQIRFKDVPSFNGHKLSDCIDFRPLILNDGSTVTTEVIDPNSTLTCKPTFYVPRLDKIIVNSNGEFKILQGLPSLNPSLPNTPPSSMVLYELAVPPYTFSYSDIGVRLIDNRRYTMRDIGTLDKRMSNMEYYTSLSLLEKAVNDKSIFDESTGARFKNGILVDPFIGHNIGDVFNPGYYCSIDGNEGILRPHFLSDSVDLVQVNSSSTVQLNENTITLPFVEVPLISQLVSSESESVNPYDVATFIGNIKLYPTNDQWFETNRKPDVIINDDGAYDALKFAIEESGVLGTEWNAWQTNWTGVIDQKTSALHSVRAPDGILRAQEITVLEKAKSRSGVKTTLKTQVNKKNLGDRVVDISFVPFIRSRKVYFSCTGLKPNTQVYPFFDGINVSLYCQEISNNEDVIRASDTTKILEYFDKLPGVGPSSIHYGDLITDANGELKGEFIVPNNSVLKFATGNRVFKLTDSINNNVNEETCFGEGFYNASGTVSTVETSILSTRVPVIKQQVVNNARTIIDTKIRYYDPLAQTFIINDIAEGVFLTSLTLYFVSKSKTSLPVSVRLVSTINGYPTQNIIPFSEVTLRSSNVKVDGSATVFKFSDPVYLKAGVEYAFVVLSNDPDYRIKVARLGSIDDMSHRAIQSNPYGGVMFMSQNASTWTPDQTRDIKFVLKRAKFNPLLDGNAIFKSVLREGILSINIDPINQGIGYSTLDTILDIGMPQESWGEQAKADPIIDKMTGKIIGANITNVGSGYTSAPSVTVLGTGTGCLATSSLYHATTSAFNLFQNAVINEKTFINNTITCGGTTFDNINAYQNYTPALEFNVSRSNILTLNSNLSTTSEFISPIIDLDNMSILCIKNEINSDLTNENTSDKGNAKSRYITREILLNDPADQLNFYLDINRQRESSRVSAYVKVKYDSTTHSDWIFVNPSSNPAVSDDIHSYSEAAYLFQGDDFIAFSIKLVFTSPYSVSVPLCKNLRVIATS